MNRTAWLATRGGAFGAAAGLAVVGLIFAVRGEGGGKPAEDQPGAVYELVEVTPTAPVTVPPAPASASATVTADTTAPALSTGATPTTAPAQAASPPGTSAPAPPPPPAATTAAPVTDLPKYRDTEVLALAAGAVLPSGMTFKQCVEAPPSTEHWPTPVHLYYEGRGRWLVETHVSEVQVEFDEGTGTFSTRNFAPVNAGCRG